MVTNAPGPGHETKQVSNPRQRHWKSLCTTEASNWEITPRLDFSRTSLTQHAQRDGDLCLQCRKIDFAAMFALDGSDVEIMGTEVATFAGHTSKLRDSECRLCRSFSTLEIIKHDTRGPVSGKFLALPASSISGTDRRHRRGLPVICALALDSRTPAWDGLLRCVSGFIGLILPSPPSELHSDKFCYGIGLQSNMNPERIREMLARCAKEHPDCRQLSHEFPTKARIIECRTRRLVPMSKNCRYLALSYVWGRKSSDKALSLEGEDLLPGQELPTSLPLTIEDAITATKILGLRYLWVDRYCIEQYHSADKKHQINQMANIYNHTVATLCALGPHDENGLPGVSQPRRSTGVFQAQGITLTFCPVSGSLQQSLSKSVWSSRGWTFQEALLSRRCIIFAEDEVHLIYRSSCQQESISQSTPFLDKRIWGSFSNIYSSILDLELRWSTDDRFKFFDYVQHYQKRQLTMDADALPAFKGILSIACNQSYYGVVVFQCPSLNKLRTSSDELGYRRGFVYGLVWEVERCGTDENNLRPSVPSWSWISRKDTLARFLVLDPTTTSLLSPVGFACASAPADGDIFVPNIYAVHDNGSSTLMGEFLESNQYQKVVPELSSYLDITSIVARFDYVKPDLDHSQSVTFHLDDDYTFKNSDGTSPLHLIFDTQRHYSEGRGIAILLLARRGPSRGVHWLVIKKVERGVYQRIGLFTYHDLLENYLQMSRLLERNMNHMTTIRLG